MKLFEIVCYTYEANYHCESCAEKRFGNRVHNDENPPEDNEGNPVTPVFISDCDETIHCGDCGELIIDWEETI